MERNPRVPKRPGGGLPRLVCPVLRQPIRIRYRDDILRDADFEKREMPGQNPTILQMD